MRQVNPRGCAPDLGVPPPVVRPAPGQDVLVSVVLPVKNEEGSIASCLKAVLNQDDFGGGMEVLVADGRSTDATRQIVETLRQTHPELILVDNPGGVVSTGFNAAIRQARGRIIVRVDGHTIIARDYVSQCLSALQRSGADNVGGPMRAEGDGHFGNAVALATSSWFGVGGARFHYSEKEEWVDTVYLGAWPREVFDRIGLFDEDMVQNQDDEFNYRLLDHGGRILLCPRIGSRYRVRRSAGALFLQYMRYGYWKVRVMQKHPRQIRARHVAPVLFVAGVLGLDVVSLFVSSARPWWLALLALYGLAALVVPLSLAPRARSWTSLGLLPLVYAILHVSYGIGVIRGLARAAVQWQLRSAKV